MSMLSGLDTTTHGCDSPTIGYPSSGLPFPLLFELLEQEGYDTQAITGGQFMKASFGFGRGSPLPEV